MAEDGVRVSYAEAVSILQTVTSQLIGNVVLTGVIAMVGHKPLPPKVLPKCR